MKNHIELKEKENLLEAIKSKVNFLTDKEIEKIVDGLDMSKKYSIVVLDNGDYGKMEKYLTYVKYDGISHNKEGEQYVKTLDIKVLLGDDHIKKLGSSYHSIFLNNETIISEMEEHESPEFDVSENIVVTLTKIYFTNYNSYCSNYQEHLLVFYKGARI